MKLRELLQPWASVAADLDIKNIQNDSRLVNLGDLFIAYPGTASDGRLYIDKAMQAGAVAVVYDPLNRPDNKPLPSTIPCIPIDSLASKLADIAQRFYHNPTAHLTVTGVTGTNGKTTIAYQLAQAHALLGQQSAYIGTIGQGNVHALEPLDNTTPDALRLVQLFHQYQQQNITQVCMEVSSHALSQHRVDAVSFTQALFTNLTLDHLDYHHSMQEYAAAKAHLFARSELKTAIINQDDAYHHVMSEVLHSQVNKLTYGINAGCDVRALSWTMDMSGTQIVVKSPWGQHQLSIKAIGQFNIYNSLAIFSSLLASGHEPSRAVDVMKRLKPAPGRLEIVADAPCVLVDYAHTPDALINVLTTLAALKKGRLWVVFGCGGDRDKSKRPVMGNAASLYADEVILTSDNPRSEDPELILNDIAQGIDSSIKITRLVHREEAIAHALNQADKHDIILIAGKGHESYQQIGSVKYDFSDKDVVRKLRSNLITP